jgi:hypothetical protein
MQGPLNDRIWREGCGESKEIHLESDSIHRQVHRLDSLVLKMYILHALYILYKLKGHYVGTYG